jgi:hypothetical protein
VCLEVLNTTPIHAAHAAALRACASRTDQAQRLTWSAAEDALILQSVDKMGQRWRKIAVLTTTPYRSNDASRHAYAHHDVLAPHRCSCPTAPTTPCVTDGIGS